MQLSVCQPLPANQTIILTEHISRTKNASLGLGLTHNNLTLCLAISNPIQSIPSYLRGCPLGTVLQILLKSRHMEEVLHSHLITNTSKTLGEVNVHILETKHYQCFLQMEGKTYV